jgi:hypothetical protein
MILTLHSIDQIFHINIAYNQYTRLRSLDINSDEIIAIASECNIDSILLAEYVADLRKTTKELLEIDGSCDYSDHL